jgi:hypothetical protein
VLLLANGGGTGGDVGGGIGEKIRHAKRRAELELRGLRAADISATRSGRGSRIEGVASANSDGAGGIDATGYVEYGCGDVIRGGDGAGGGVGEVGVDVGIRCESRAAQGHCFMRAAGDVGIGGGGGGPSADHMYMVYNCRATCRFCEHALPGRGTDRAFNGSNDDSGGGRSHGGDAAEVGGGSSNAISNARMPTPVILAWLEPVGPAASASERPGPPRSSVHDGPSSRSDDESIEGDRGDGEGMLGRCEPIDRYVFVKTHKTGGSTLANILHRRTVSRGLTPVLPKTLVNMGWSVHRQLCRSLH